MWVAGSVFFLVPLGLITIELMSTQRVSRKRTRRASEGSRDPVLPEVLCTEGLQSL
jgi:hypothetical protein